MYLHELIPVVISCVVSKQLCQRKGENHWALRNWIKKDQRLLLSHFEKLLSTLELKT